MIIGCEVMVQLGLLDDCKRKVLQWDGVTVTMKEPRCLLGQTDQTSREIHKVVMHTEEPVSTR